MEGERTQQQQFHLRGGPLALRPQGAIDVLRPLDGLLIACCTHGTTHLRIMSLAICCSFLASRTLLTRDFSNNFEMRLRVVGCTLFFFSFFVCVSTSLPFHTNTPHMRSARKHTHTNTLVGIVFGFSFLEISPIALLFSRFLLQRQSRFNILLSL